MRSGGHALEGWSGLDDGVVIDVSGLKSVAIDAQTLTATVGAGLNQLEAVTGLGAAGFAALPEQKAASGWSARRSAAASAC